MVHNMCCKAIFFNTTPNFLLTLQLQRVHMSRTKKNSKKKNIIDKGPASVPFVAQDTIPEFRSVKQKTEEQLDAPQRNDTHKIDVSAEKVIQSIMKSTNQEQRRLEPILEYEAKATVQNTIETVQNNREKTLFAATQAGLQVIDSVRVHENVAFGV